MRARVVYRPGASCELHPCWPSCALWQPSFGKLVDSHSKRQLVHPSNVRQQPRYSGRRLILESHCMVIFLLTALEYIRQGLIYLLLRETRHLAVHALSPTMSANFPHCAGTAST